MAVDQHKVFALLLAPTNADRSMFLNVSVSGVSHPGLPSLTQNVHVFFMFLFRLC